MGIDNERGRTQPEHGAGAAPPRVLLVPLTLTLSHEGRGNQRGGERDEDARFAGAAALT